MASLIYLQLAAAEVVAVMLLLLPPQLADRAVAALRGLLQELQMARPEPVGKVLPAETDLRRIRMQMFKQPVAAAVQALPDKMPLALLEETEELVLPLPLPVLLSLMPVAAAAVNEALGLRALAEPAEEELVAPKQTALMP